MDDLRALEEEPTMLLGLSLHSASLSLLALFSQPGFLCEQQQFPLIVPALCFPKLSTWEEAAPFNFCIKTIQGQDCDWPSWCQCLPTPPTRLLRSGGNEHCDLAAPASTTTSCYSQAEVSLFRREILQMSLQLIKIFLFNLKTLSYLSGFSFLES